MDLAFMPDFNGYKYFSVVIDVFSKHMYTRLLKDKTVKIVGKSFKEIFEEFGSPIFKLESDNVIIFKSDAKCSCLNLFYKFYLI